jgi:hypothetical protein
VANERKEQGCIILGGLRKGLFNAVLRLAGHRVKNQAAFGERRFAAAKTGVDWLTGH